MLADGDGKVRGLLVEIVGDVVVGGLIAQLVQARDFELIGFAVAFELRICWRVAMSRSS